MEAPTTGSERLSLALYALSLVLSLVTAASTFYVRAEVMETRLLILEKIHEAGRDWVTRREFDSLAGRLSVVEIGQRKP